MNTHNLTAASKTDKILSLKVFPFCPIRPPLNASLYTIPFESVDRNLQMGQLYFVFNYEKLNITILKTVSRNIILLQLFNIYISHVLTIFSTCRENRNKRHNVLNTQSTST